jgi:hypothetical protein
MYFKGRIYHGAEVHHYVVWDGVRDYQSLPPVAGVLATEFPAGTGTVYIAQIGKPGRSVRTALLGLIATGSNTHVILWARDHRTYRDIVKEMERGDAWLQ